MREFNLHNNRKIMVAGILILATFLISCKRKLPQIDQTDISSLPMQSIEDMRAVQTENGRIKMRMEAARMDRYENDKEETSYELFPIGFIVYGYNDAGDLETEIVADQAKHTTTKSGEKWEAYDNVVITNFLKQEKMETDTLYWDRENQRIYTHCFVKMTSPDGFMQGWGMESDEMARNAVVIKPFDSHGIIKKDTLVVNDME